MLVFDEPTAVLTPQETDELMEIMRQLKEAGKAIVFITHKLREVREVADRITVIRRGKVVGEAEPTASNAELASLMVGRPVELAVHKDAPQLGERRARRRGPHASSTPLGHVHVDGISFTIRAGEVLGVAGVQGNGQTELTEALLGLQDARRGLDHARRQGARRPVRPAGPRRRASASSPRTARPTAWSAASPSPRTSCSTAASGDPFVRRGSLRLDALEEFADARSSRSTTSAPPTSTPTPGKLSGGNQQKVVVARELSRDLRAARRRAADARRRRRAPSSSSTSRSSPPATAAIPVLVVSTELDEVVALADRIMVLYRGRVVGIVPGDTPRETLGLMMTGERPKDAVA